jgi:hypothetical protein
MPIRTGLPHALVQPGYRDLFDRIVDWAYDEALEAQAKGKAAHLTENAARRFLEDAAAATGPGDIRHRRDQQQRIVQLDPSLPANALIRRAALV